MAVMKIRLYGIILVLGLTVAACVGDRNPVSSPPDPSSGEHDRQTGWRVRADRNAPLNGDTGWAGPANQPVSVVADQPFRLRLEVEAGADPTPRRYGLQVRRNDGDWQAVQAEDFPYPEKVFAVALDDQTVAFGALFQLEQGAAESLQRAADGSVRLASGREELVATARLPIEWRPSEFALDLRLPDETAAHIDIAVMTFGNGEHAGVRLIPPNRVAVLAWTGMRERLLAERHHPLATERWLTLKIGVDEEGLTVELDDEPILEMALGPELRGEPRLGIRLPPGHEVDLRSVGVEGEASSPPVSIVSSPAFAHGTPTADLLPLSSRAFTGGAGVSFAERTPPWLAADGHGEWSFPLVIRRFSDQAALNEHGDRFEFRLVRSDGRVVDAARAAVVTLSVPEGRIGGTFVETPMRLGPWQTPSGDLYFIIEPSETWNRMMMIRSRDGGRSWREVDGANRPLTGDLEGLGSRFVDGRIHVLHQTSDQVLYHAFDTAEAPGRSEGWAIRDEAVAAPPEPPTQIADLAVRADGRIVAFYGAGNGIEYRVRSVDGQWAGARAADDPQGRVLSGVSVVRSRDDVIHIAWTTSDGEGWYRRLGPDLALGEATRFATGLATGEADVGALLPLVHAFAPDRLFLLYRAADGHLYERSVAGTGRWTGPAKITARTVAQSPVDSDQVAADAIVHGDTVHVLFVEAASGQLFHTAGGRGAWTEAKRVVADAPVQWVRGNRIAMPDGSPAYGFVYDAGSNGGSGMNRYDRIPLTLP